MASGSTTILTKYESAVTIVTAEVANSWFGGLYGSFEGSTKLATDPLVAGHAHDGLHQNGHAQKINLVSHVTGQLRNTNIADDAVTKRNVSSFVSQGQAIPESELIDGTVYYYLDLTDVYSAILDCFGVLDIQANGGTVTGDGVGVIEADQTQDTLTLYAGTGIEIETDQTNDALTIKAVGGIDDIFNQVVLTASGGTASGGPVVASGPTNPLGLVAGPGITLTGDAITDTVKIETEPYFSTFGLLSAGTGVTAGTSPIVADTVSDTLGVVAGDGIMLTGDAVNDKIAISNMYSFASGIIHPEETFGAWAAATTNTIGLTPDNDFLYQHRVVSDDANGVQFWIPMVQNVYNERPRKIKIRTYYVCVDTGLPAYLNGTQNFTMRMRHGSNSNQTDPGETNQIGTIPTNTPVDAGISQLWALSIDQISVNVTATGNLIIIEFPINELQLNENTLGIFQLKLIGLNGFGAGEAFSGEGGKAEAHFIGADYTWFY